MKKIIYILAVILLGLASCKQDSTKMLNKTAEFETLNAYIWKANLDSLPFSIRHSYADKALAIVSKRPNDSMNRKFYFLVANRYWNMGAKEDYKNLSIEILENAKRDGDSASIAKTYEYLGDYYKKGELSFLYYFKAQKIYRKIKLQKNVIDVMYKISTLQIDEKDYIGSEKNLIECLKLLTKKDDLLRRKLIYSCLGIIYNELKDTVRALTYYKKSININDDIYREHSILIFNNIGLLYQDNNHHDKALQFFKKAISPKLFFENARAYASILDNLAYSKLKTKDYTQLPQLFFKSLKISDSVQNVSGTIICRSNLSEYYADRKDTATAIRFASEAYATSKKYHLPRNGLQPLKLLAAFDRKNAATHLQDYIKTNDSLQLAERKMRNKFASIEYETEELSTQKTNLVSQKTKTIYTSVGFLLLISVIIVFGYYVQKNRELKLQQQQQQANSEIYELMIEEQQKVEEGKRIEKKRIAKELHDGVMGRLNSIRLNLFVLNKKTDDETIDKCLGHISDIQSLEKEIRTIAQDLQKNVFSDTLHFTTVVQNLFESIGSHSDLDFRLYADERIDWNLIATESKIHIYRILQEALQNIDKYASATKVSISMQQQDELMVITVADNGKGFDPNKVKPGIGLKSIPERAFEIGGSVDIHSSPGLGTTITLSVPLPLKNQSL